jgi:pyruvoyl-dependent arginine decarboxylase (PvlArgDC)
MKIVIKGHESRGKEVIQILESLGGRNQMLHTGRYTGYFYYINNDNIITWTSVRPRRSNIFTLEEFEKEFPFKIGDIVLIVGAKTPNKIIALELCMNRLCYKLNNGLHYDSETLKPYKEMKEERNITLTLEKAQEWYKKGGELKEVALQAFTEKELTEIGLPKTWEEFCKKYPIKRGEFYITSLSEINENTCSRNRCSDEDKNVCSSKKSAEAHLAMIQLEQLRDCWRQGWEPDWLNDNEKKYAIKGWGDKISIETTYVTHSFLSFPTYEMAEEFLKCFRDLIEKAGDLI